MRRKHRKIHYVEFLRSKLSCLYSSHYHEQIDRQTTASHSPLHVISAINQVVTIAEFEITLHLTIIIP